MRKTTHCPREARRKKKRKTIPTNDEMKNLSFLFLIFQSFEILLLIFSFLASFFNNQRKTWFSLKIKQNSMKFFTKSRIARFLFSVPVFKVRRLFLCRVFFLFFRSLSSSTPTSSQPANERTRWQRNPTVFFFVHYLRGSARLFVCKNLCIFFSVCMCIFLFYFLKKFFSLLLAVYFMLL